MYPQIKVNLSISLKYAKIGLNTSKHRERDTEVGRERKNYNIKSINEKFINP